MQAGGHPGSLGAHKQVRVSPAPSPYPIVTYDEIKTQPFDTGRLIEEGKSPKEVQMESQLFPVDPDEVTALPDSSREGTKLVPGSTPNELSASSKFIP